MHACSRANVEEVAEEVPKVVMPLPQVTIEETADEDKFDCPQPWFLALLTVAKSAMTSITVAGSLFFLLAAPEKVSPRCFERDTKLIRVLCTASTIAFWTYPVVCCLFVVIVFCKNMVDQRTFYEFLLHKVLIGYGRANPFRSPIVFLLLVYALAAFSSLVWFHLANEEVLIGHIYGSLAYITPIISFLAVIFTSWSIQGKLITLPNFLEDYDWAVKHLNVSRCYPEEELHEGYLCLEKEMNLSDEILDTPRIVALVEHYTQQFHTREDIENPDVEAPAETLKPSIAGSVEHAQKQVKAVAEAVTENLKVVATKTKKAAERPEWVYWQVRLLFNPRLQDDRSRSFKNWAIAYLTFVFLAIILSIYVFVCCLITCLEMERVLTPDGRIWTWTHMFSLRPDLDNGLLGHKRLKQMAASVASLSAVQTGGRSFYQRASRSLFHFHIGAVA